MELQELRSRLINKRLIFSISSGRSGTGYLARILNYVPNVACFHEPEPNFLSVMRLAQQDINVAYPFEWQIGQSETHQLIAAKDS